MKLEYKVVRIPGGTRMTEERLNELGLEGWDVVHVTGPGNEWVFKRAKPATRTAAKKAAAK